MSARLGDHPARQGRLPGQEAPGNDEPGHDRAGSAAAARSDQAPRRQRARGALNLSCKRRGEATALDTLRQEGCLKARFPRPAGPGWLDAVMINTAGGIAGGDRLQSRAEAQPGARVTLAAQAAERIYRALPGETAHVGVSLHVADAAALEWLPQETILFDRCALRRRLDVTLAPGAWFLGVESLVFGRAAMGEQVAAAAIDDRITVRREGKLLLHDAIRLDGPVAARLARPAIGGGARAIATLLHAGPGATERIHALRDALAPFDAGASAFDGLVVARVVAPDGAGLRRAVVAGLNILRQGRTLPRVWQC